VKDIATSTKPYDAGDHVLNRARLYRDRRDLVIQPGDTGNPEDYPANPGHSPRGSSSEKG